MHETVRVKVWLKVNWARTVRRPACQVIEPACGQSDPSACGWAALYQLKKRSSASSLSHANALQALRVGRERQQAGQTDRRGTVVGSNLIKKNRLSQGPSRIQRLCTSLRLASPKFASLLGFRTVLSLSAAAAFAPTN